MGAIYCRRTSQIPALSALDSIGVRAMYAREPPGADGSGRGESERSKRLFSDALGTRIILSLFSRAIGHPAGLNRIYMLKL